MTRSWPGRARAFFSDCNGNVAIIFGLVAPILVGGVGAALDYAAANSQHAALQAAADAGAIAGARELAHSGASQLARIEEVAVGIAHGKLGESSLTSAAAVAVRLTETKSGVTVDVSQTASSYFGDLLGTGDTELRATATAETLGEKICVIGLEESSSDGVRLEDNAQLSAGGCSVYSNSTNPNAIRVDGNARLKAQSICSAGGYEGGANNFDPLPLTDCPTAPDPLAHRTPPEVDGCDHTKFEVNTGTRTLLPGTYCKGLMINGNAKVVLQPGIYVIKDGPFVADSDSEVSGEHVGFYFTGANATLRFAANSRIDLGAPREGPMAGILFWEDRASPGLQTYKITSNNARNLLGTIYLPNGRFHVDAEQTVADRSAYTALVVRRLELSAGPNLVLNDDYGATDVPVPTGLGPTGATRLVR